MKNKLIIMCGLPRTGKTTWINKNKKDAIVVSSDDIRETIFGHKFHYESNKFVFAFVEAMVIILLKQNKTVIVDATNLTFNLRYQWAQIAEKYNCNCEIVWVYISKDPQKNLEECLKRNRLSIEKDRVPEQSLIQMNNFFEEPEEIPTKYKLIEFKNI